MNNEAKLKTHSLQNINFPKVIPQNPSLCINSLPAKKQVILAENTHSD